MANNFQGAVINGSAVDVKGNVKINNTSKDEKYDQLSSGKFNEPIINKKIFIVHGHDNEVKEKVARFIEKLDLTATILHEQASSGLSILEKIESYSDVGFAVVLYTACDEGKAKTESNFKYRARQNVIFEHGYLIGKLGRRKVCVLVNGDIELPSDISGIIYIIMDNRDAWKLELVKVMKNAGYKIDLNTIV